MQKLLFSGSFIFFLVWLSSCSTPDAQSGQAAAKDDRFDDFIYQYSVMDALLAGSYDGNLNFGELKKRGDFGIGTFNRLDGELLVLDGKVHKIRHNGDIDQVADADTASLAVVKFFKADTTFTLTGKDVTYAQLLEKLNTTLNSNSLYAIRVTGNFKTMKARSVKPASKPYMELSAYLEKGGQQLFDFTDAKGVCAGFLLPAYTARTNVPGIHLHFISDERKNGGHVFDFTTDELKVEIDEARGLIVERNSHQLFDHADLQQDRKKQLEAVE